MPTIIVDAKKLVKEHMEMTVTVRTINVRQVKIRLWIAVQLCRLAAWIGGYGLKINQEVGVLITDSRLAERERK